MYPDVGDDQSAPDTDQEPDSTDKNEKDSGSETTLIPKSMCAGMEIKPGESLTFKVVSVHDDEVEVEYDSGNEKKQTDSEDMSSAMSGMDSMSGE